MSKPYNVISASIGFADAPRDFPTPAADWFLLWRATGGLLIGFDDGPALPLSARALTQFGQDKVTIAVDPAAAVQDNVAFIAFYGQGDPVEFSSSTVVIATSFVNVAPGGFKAALAQNVRRRAVTFQTDGGTVSISDAENFLAFPLAPNLPLRVESGVELWVGNNGANAATLSMLEEFQ